MKRKKEKQKRLKTKKLDGLDGIEDEIEEGEKSKKSKVLIYLLGSIALMILVGMAIWLPQLVLHLQDGQNMKEAHYEVRSGLDYTGMYTEYEEDLYNRMYRFAKGCEEGQTYYVAATDSTIEPEDLDVLLEELDSRDSILMRLPFCYHEAYGEVESVLDLLYNYYYNNYVTMDGSTLEIIQKQSCVIYDDNAENGAAFVCLYFQIGIKDVFNIYLLVDQKDYTIYYLEFIGNADYLDNYVRVAEIYSLVNYFYQYVDYYYGTISKEAIQELEKAEIGIENTDEEINKKEFLNGQSLEERVIFQSSSQDVLQLHLPILYEQNSLHFDVIAKYNKQQVRMGIQEIIDLLHMEK